MKRWIALAAALAVSSSGLTVGFGTPAQAVQCTSQSAAAGTDPNIADPSPETEQSQGSASSSAQAADCSSPPEAPGTGSNTADPSTETEQSQDSEPPRQAPATDTATDASAPRKPTPSDGYRPLILLHGFSPTGSVNCNNYWGNGEVERYLNDTRGWAGKVRKLTYYQSGGTGCARIPGAAGINQPIEDLGSEFAWYIYNTYSHSGVAVDVIAHSMGGLVARIAIEGTQHRFMTGSGRTFPPYLYIEDVATLSSPHEGARSSVWGGCGVGYREVCEMIPGSSFLSSWIAPYGNPQSTMGTDWSFIGSGDDWVVNTGSALDRKASRHPGHKYLYLSGSGLDHGQMANITENGRGWKYPILYCHYNASCDMSGWESGTWFKYNNGKGAGPLWVAANAVFYHSTW